MRNLAVIPARSGSKGLKDKNIRVLNGKPLMAYSIEAALRSGACALAHVSTDSGEYARVAREYGADVPFLRSEELSADTSTTWDAVRFVLEEYGKRGQAFDAVTVLQPTSPLRTAKDVADAFALFLEKQAESVISVCEAEHSPLWCGLLPADGCMKGFLRETADAPRQQLGAYYRLNGAIYIVSAKTLAAHGSLYGERSYAYVMDKRHSVDIDDETDFAMAEFFFGRAE